MNFVRTIVAAGAVLAASQAGAVAVTGYDITNALDSGAGGWSHNYTGTITPTGNSGGLGGLSNYTGGSGTLNDGIIPNTPSNNQLFEITRFPTTITVFLASATKLTSIDFTSADPGNAIPGNITGVTVTIGSTSQSFTTVPFGPATCCGYQFGDSAVITGALAALGTTSFTLSNFTTDNSSGFGFFYNIGELTVSGTPAVPEPATWALLIAGFGLVGVSMRRRAAVAA